MGWTTGHTNINVHQIIRPSLIPAEGIGIISSMGRAKYFIWSNAPAWEGQRISRIELRIIEDLSTNLYHRDTCENNPGEDGYALMLWQEVLWPIIFHLALFSADAGTYCSISLIPFISAYLFALGWQPSFYWLQGNKGYLCLCPRREGL